MNIEYKQEELGLRLQIECYLTEKMKSIALKHFPNEFGGVLVGHYSEDGLAVVVENIICPKKYKQSPTYFERHPKYINKTLAKVYRKSEGKTFYIGEWHSHPNMQPIPSSHDLASMRGLLSEDIKITNPLLLIVGGTKSNLSINYFLLHQNQLLEYE